MHFSLWLFVLKNMLLVCAMAIAPDCKSAQQAGMPQHEGVELIYGNLAPVIFSINLVYCCVPQCWGFLPRRTQPCWDCSRCTRSRLSQPSPDRIMLEDLFSAALLRSLVLMISSLAGIADMLKRRRAHPDRTGAAADPVVLAAGTERFFDPAQRNLPAVRRGDPTLLLPPMSRAHAQAGNLFP